MSSVRLSAMGLISTAALALPAGISTVPGTFNCAMPAGMVTKEPIGLPKR